MAGYDWSNGKSNNAVQAESEGKFPLSKITKTNLMEFDIGITLKDAKLLAKHEYWLPAEWHHTSKHFNVTDYYNLYDLKEIIATEDYNLYLSNIKAELAEAKEDIIYAKIEVTDFYKGKRGRWIPDVRTFTAIVRNYYSVGDYCTYNSTRKKKSNVNVILEMSKEEYDSKMEELRLYGEKLEKEARISRLRNLKKDLLMKYDFLIERYLQNEDLKTLVKKVKNARKIKSVEKLQISISNLVDLLEKEFIEKAQDKEVTKKTLDKEVIKKLKETCVDGINLDTWVMLPKEAKHPAPKNIMEAKIKSGLGWNTFERELKRVG